MKKNDKKKIGKSKTIRGFLKTYSDHLLTDVRLLNKNDNLKSSLMAYMEY
jgi:hypothetical protein